MDKFLNKLRNEGAPEESGQFTVSLEEARRKLTSARLRPGYYILKFVQAAVKAGSTRIELRFGRDQIDLNFSLAAAYFTPEKALTNLDLLHHDDKAWQHFMIGMKSCLASEPDRFRWAHWHEETGRSSLVVTGSGPKILKNPPQARPSSDYPHCFSLSVGKRQTGWFRSATHDEWLAVNERCCHAPIDIWVDGRQLEPGTYGLSRSKTLPLITKITPDNHGPLRVSPFSPTHSYSKGPQGWSTTVALGARVRVLGTSNAHKSPRRVKQMLLLGYGSLSTIVLVRDGVSLDPIVVSKTGAATALLGAGATQTDLSEFGVLDNSARQELVDRVVREWESFHWSPRPY